MMTVAQNLMQESPMAAGMRDYLEELKLCQETNPVLAKQNSIDALKRMGLLTEAGEAKEKIVSWE